MATLIFYSILFNLIFGLLCYKRLKSEKNFYFVQFIPLAIAAASAIAQGVRAKKQRDEAKKALNYRNTSIEQAVDSANAQQNQTRYPGQDVAEANARQATADAFANINRSTRSSADLVNATARLQAQQQRTYQTIGQNVAAFRQGAADKYRSLLLQRANVQDANRQYSEALKGAAAQNDYNAIQTLGNGVAMSNFGGNSYNPYNPYGNQNWGWNPSSFSTYRWYPNAFSTGNFR